MREIQQQIKNCDIKAPRQVATCQIPKCLSCSKKREETIAQIALRIHHKR
jgi:hypothetical protein